jgi:hypothetical protein
MPTLVPDAAAMTLALTDCHEACPHSGVATRAAQIAATTKMKRRARRVYPSPSTSLVRKGNVIVFFL